MSDEKKLPTIELGKTFRLSDGGPVVTTTQSSKATIIMYPGVAPAPVPPLDTVEYEAGMFFGAVDGCTKIQQLEPSLRRIVRNALAESALLHARTLCAIFLNEGRKSSEIRLERLLDPYAVDSHQRKVIDDAVGELETAYGKESDEKSPRFIINSMVMHPTYRRGDHGMYDDVVNLLLSPIREIVRALETLVGKKFEPIE